MQYGRPQLGMVIPPFNLILVLDFAKFHPIPYHRIVFLISLPIPSIPPVPSALTYEELVYPDEAVPRGVEVQEHLLKLSGVQVDAVVT
jgi:hypothetical protein